MAVTHLPGFIVLSQNLAGAAAEFALVPNIPPLAIQNQLNLITQQLGQLVLQLDGMQRQFNAMQQQLNTMQQQLNAMQVGQDLLPIRLQNAIASLDAPLQYPFNIPLPAQAPETKQQLLTLTRANCQLVAQALNLPVLPNNATVVQCRQQIMDYLGCGIIAY